MWLKSITVCCLLLNVQPQRNGPLTEYNNQGMIYYQDDFDTLRNREQNNNNAPSNIHLNNQSQKPRTSSVQIGKSEIESTIDQQNDNRQVFNPMYTTASPSQNLAQLFGLQGQVGYNLTPEQQYYKGSQRVPQNSQEAQRQHESSLSTQGLANFSQSGQKIPQPAVSQSALNKPAGYQNPSKPPLSSSNSNSLTDTAPVFKNKPLYHVTNFGINMIKTAKVLRPGNLVISPFSITLLLSLLQQGASGQTQEQITKALRMTPETTATAYHQVSQNILARSSRNILRVANNIFVSRENFALKPEFEDVARNFNSEITPLSFSRPEGAVSEINNWVAKRTDGKIENLIASGAIDRRTQMVLVNAIYFKGLWEVPFRVELTKSKEFYLSNGQTKMVPFMQMRKLFRTGIDRKSNAQVIVIPFERDEYQLMVIIPSEFYGMDRTLEDLTEDRLVSYLAFEASDTELELPKFTIRADTDLTVVLKKMNITDLFRRDLSELYGIGSFGHDGPYISSAVHSAFLSVDEKGGTAAAATAFAAVALSYDDPDFNFKVNSPFIAVLWDKQSYLPLIMAKVEDPQLF